MWGGLCFGKRLRPSLTAAEQAAKAAASPAAALRRPRAGFTGGLPPEILRLSNLTTLHLEGNQLNGTLPRALCGSLPQLEYLNVGGNGARAACAANPIRALRALPTPLF